MLKFLTYTHIFIAFSAAVLTIGTGLRFGNIGHLLPYLVLIFFATLADYNWHRFLKVKLSVEVKEKNRWAQENNLLILILAISGTFGLLVSACFVPFEIIEWLVLLGFLTLFYSFPFQRLGWHWMDVRKIPALKTLLIAFTWTMATLYLPYLLSNKSEHTTYLILLFAERFLFIFAITIPFDSKDIEEDKKAGWETLPVLLGINNATKVSYAALTWMMILSVLSLLFKPTDLGGYAGIVAGLYTIFLLQRKTLKTDPLYYAFYLDGTILLLGLMLIALGI